MESTPTRSSFGADKNSPSITNFLSKIPVNIFIRQSQNVVGLGGHIQAQIVLNYHICA